MLSHRLQLRLTAALALCVAANAASICSLVNESDTTTLSCPAGEVVSSIDMAVFGTYEDHAACPHPVPKSECPVPVTAQVKLLCLGRSNCTVECQCNADQDPACRCSNPDSELATGVPAFPCNGIQKQLAVSVSCGPMLPAEFVRQVDVAESDSGPTDLQIEYLEAPVLGLDERRPHFGWTVSDPSGQAEFQVDVYTVSQLPSSVWSSGRVENKNPMLVPATDLPLLSDTEYSWTVTVWNSAGVSTVSQPARFATGLFEQNDWGDAEWIDAGYCSESADLTTTGTCSGGLLRTEFSVNEGAVFDRASLFISACQYYELYLDGVRIGDNQLDVGWTRFARNRSYTTMNLSTALFPPGKHALGLMVGTGFCGEPSSLPNNSAHRAALLSLRLYSGNHSSPLQTVVTRDDGTWEAGQSPLRWDSAYFGEYYEASSEQPGWSMVGFQPSAGRSWAPAGAIKYSPAPWLGSQLMQPIRVVEEIEPLSCLRVLAEPGSSTLASPARWTFDMGLEISGHVRLSLPAGIPPNTNFTLRHAEALSHPPLPIQKGSVTTKEISKYDGSVYMGNLFWAVPIDVFQSSPNTSAGPQVYEPRFTYHGFRYVELEATPPLSDDVAAHINISSVTGVRVRTDTTGRASGHVANPTLQYIWDNSIGSESSALLSIPNGAAGRGERAGWTGDAAAASESEMVDFNAGAFFSQYLRQVGDLACDADATLANCIPESDPRRDSAAARPDPATCTGETKDPSWSTVYPTITHNLWRYFNATRAVEDQYDKLGLYMRTLAGDINSSGLGNILCTWGDWNPVVRTPCTITAATSYIHDLQRMQDLATAMGKSADAEMYSRQAAQLTEAFHDAFWNASAGVYSTGTQMAQAAALWVGAVPSTELPKHVANLAEDVVQNGVTFGFLGVQYVFEALAKNGRVDAALECLLRTSDGYGHEIFNLYEPSTSLWESWDGDTMHQWLDESSRSHHYQASISTFMRKYVAGVDIGGEAIDAAGWSAVRIRPEAALLPARLRKKVPAAAIRLHTAHGEVKVSWQHHFVSSGLDASDDSIFLVLNASLPWTVDGEVHVPKLFGDRTVIRLAHQVIWAGSNSDISKNSISTAEGVRLGVAGERFVTFHTGGGQFVFTSSA